MREASSPDRVRAPAVQYAAAFAALVLALLFLFGPPLARGQVLYPHRNQAQFGMRPIEPGKLVYEDQAQLHLPEIHAHLVCERTSWLATWNPHNELGRRVFHLGFGSAFLPFNALSWLTKDPYRFASLHVILAIVATGLFAFGFLCTLGLGPLACLVGSLGISAGPLFGGAQVSPMLQWGYCWAFCSLLAFERWLRRPSIWNWLAIAFAVHAILLTGFQQHVILLGWIVGGWILLRVSKHTANTGTRVRNVGLILGATLCGVLASLPVYADVFVEWSRSTRAGFETHTTHFLDAGGILKFALSLYHVFWEPDVPAQSFSLSPVYASLVAIALLGLRDRHCWYWALWVGYLLLGSASATVAPTFRFLGLVLSDWPEVLGIQLPVAVLSALGLERIQRASPTERRLHLVASAVLLLAAALATWGVSAELDPWRVVLGFGLGVGACLFAWFARAWLLVPLLAITVLHDVHSLTVWQDREAILESSPLAIELQQRTQDGSRYAWVGPRFERFPFLPPNAEIPLGLRSVHTYYHLQSREYDDAFGPLQFASPDERKYTRVFDAIRRPAPKLLRRSGVSTLVSRHPLETDFSSAPVPIGRVWVSTVRERAPLQAVIPTTAFRLLEDRRIELLGADENDWTPAAKDSDTHDRVAVTFDVTEEPALLFLSQQYHPSWRARTQHGELETVLIDDLFQGVLLPPGTDSVVLTFEPWVRWAWLPQVLFGVAGLLALTRTRLWSLSRSPAT